MLSLRYHPTASCASNLNRDRPWNAPDLGSSRAFMSPRSTIPVDSLLSLRSPINFGHSQANTYQWKWEMAICSLSFRASRVPKFLGFFSLLRSPLENILCTEIKPPPAPMLLGISFAASFTLGVRSARINMSPGLQSETEAKPVNFMALYSERPVIATRRGLERNENEWKRTDLGAILFNIARRRCRASGQD